MWWFLFLVAVGYLIYSSVQKWRQESREAMDLVWETLDTVTWKRGREIVIEIETRTNGRISIAEVFLALERLEEEEQCIQSRTINLDGKQIRQFRRKARGRRQRTHNTAKALKTAPAPA